MLDLSHIPIVDHHAHPLLRPTAIRTPVHFQRWFTESTEPAIHIDHAPHSLLFRTAVRWLAPLLGCEPAAEAILAARAAQDEATWVRRLFDDAKIEIVLCDYGYGGVDGYGHADMQWLLARRVEPILRLEKLAEQLILDHGTFAGMVDAYTAAVAGARAAGFVALKSIIAYRSGLMIAPEDRQDAKSGFATLHESGRRQGYVRLDNKPLCDYLVHVALHEAEKQELPVQLHTGFGDSDADLRTANPLHLRPIIESYRRAPLVLLHSGWPYSRELAHLSAIYANVWMDLSLAIPFATVSIPSMLQEALGMAPFSKILFATDAFTMPEIFWIAARWGRWGLGKVLGEMITEGFLRRDEALSAAAAILGDNARQLYGLVSSGSSS
jgi:predicted TIM-barrel fold metal-dependent hydrolase